MPLATPKQSLSEPARRYLLAQARKAMRAALTGAVPEPAPPAPEGVSAGRGCFVSVHGPEGELRGCIGTLDAMTPLLDNVREMAAAAVTSDYRFEALTAEELPRCQVEISALTAPHPASLADIHVGTHGVIVERGRSRGLLLPQVASERGWDARTFVEQTCRKAGLPSDAWERDREVKLLAFEAEVFSEEASVAAELG